jgi:hypothetical protein
MVYGSRDVIFDEENFPFTKLNSNVGAPLRSEITLLHPTLFHYDCGDITTHGHISDNPLPVNVFYEMTGENLGEDCGQNSSAQENIGTSPGSHSKWNQLRSQCLRLLNRKTQPPHGKSTSANHLPSTHRACAIPPLHVQQLHAVSGRQGGQDLCAR